MPKLGSLAITAKTPDAAFRDRIRAAGEKIARRVAVPAVKAAAASLHSAIRDRIPVETGTARAALRLETEVASSGNASFTITYDTSIVNQRSSNHFFYPAVIEYGDGRRPPIAPMRRALDLDWPKIRSAMFTEIASGIESLSR